MNETAIPFAQGLELEKRLKAEGRKDIIAEATPGLIWEHIDLNLDNPHLKDKRVRQALLYAADREAIVRSLFEG
ncbi:MAG: ABC transporter substrate-binding protein, partial [candidate division KSB1 bacterium]|nr:ABC transporter substrate-binding protein [candidate division KSB1 bacterium]